MSPPAQDTAFPTRASSPPPPRWRIGGPPPRLLAMLAVGFLLASPVISLLIAGP